MQARQQLGSRGSAPADGSLEHLMMAGRARALTDAGVEGLRARVREAESSPSTPLSMARHAGILYAGALSAAKLREHPSAARLAGRLSTLVQADAKAARLARLLTAETALLAGEAARAAELSGSDSRSRAELLLGAQAQLQLGRAPTAAQRLLPWVALHPRDATAWQLLEAAYTAQGQTLRAVRAGAEAQVAVLDYAAAMDRFKAAPDVLRRAAGAPDHIEASIIDTRTRQVELLLREQALER
jgi:predicted Zn-dependent protease